MRLIIGFILISFLACSKSPNGNSWIIKTSSQCITVSELGAEWNDLDSASVAGFLEDGNPVGDFISLYSRKVLVVEEISNSDYLFSTGIQSFRDSYIRNSSYAAFCDSVHNEFLSCVTEEDITVFSGFFGKTVWYSESTGTEREPVELQYLFWDLALAFDTMSAGESVEINGLFDTLDSVTTVSDSLIAVSFHDPQFRRSYSISHIAQQRLSNEVMRICKETVSTFQADTSAISSFLHNPDSVEDSTVLASWNTGSFTAADFYGMMSFSAVSSSAVPSSLKWGVLNLKNHAMMDQIETVFKSSNSSVYGEILREAESLAMKRASDLLYTDRVLSAISVTDSMLIDSYESMDSLPIIPETRVFESVVIPESSLDAALEYVGESRNPDSLGYQGIPSFLAQGEDFLSRPVTASELPGEMGTVLFILEESNREWQSPMEVGEGVFVMFRLNSIIPPHPAEFEQLEGSIRTNLQAHLEEQATMDWLRELEEKHCLEINASILDDLPDDISRWAML